MAEIDKPATSTSDEKPKAGIFERAFDSAVKKIDQKHPWYELPEPLGLTELIGIRNTLRQENLKDTSRLQAIDPAQPPPPDARKRHLEHRPAGRGALTRRRPAAPASACSAARRTWPTQASCSPISPTRS